jgi:hypothetical protein
MKNEYLQAILEDGYDTTNPFLKKLCPPPHMAKNKILWVALKEG